MIKFIRLHCSVTEMQKCNTKSTVFTAAVVDLGLTPVLVVVLPEPFGGDVYK